MATIIATIIVTNNLTWRSVTGLPIFRPKKLMNFSLELKRSWCGRCSSVISTLLS